MGQFTGDSAVYPGEGVPDLDKVISLIAAGTQRSARFFVDTGGPGFAVPKQFDIDDLLAIRAYYIGFYGNVAKPNVYAQPVGEAIAP